MSQKVTRKKKKTGRSASLEQTALPTLMDHLQELQGRLFSTVLVIVLAAGAAYPFFGKIVDFLVAPLKPGQDLVYLTPGGALSFMIMVCFYIGLIVALPVIIYHLYQFIMPAVRATNMIQVIRYTVASFLLAVCGVAFAYYVSLPAALYFLTSFDLNHINPMLTIDSYFSFILTYILAGALLFQLPIIMLIINGVTPLTPKKLMSYQGKILLGSFIVAAVISPTPDALNQTLLASPIVVMYQVGIVIIWFKNRKLQKRQKRQAQAASLSKQSDAIPAGVARPLPLPLTPQSYSSPVTQAARTMSGIKQPASATRLPKKPIVIPKPAKALSRGHTVPSLDMVRPRTRMTVSRSLVVQSRVRPHEKPLRSQPVSPFRSMASQSVDGMVASRRISS